MVVPDLEIEISGLHNLADVKSGQQGSAVAFSAGELVTGASRTGSAGTLNFKITVQEAKRRVVDGVTNVEGRSVVLSVLVSPK